MARVATYIRTLLPPEASVAVFGACIGIFSMDMASRIPKAHFYCCEDDAFALEHNQQMLQKGVLQLNYARIVNMSCIKNG